MSEREETDSKSPEEAGEELIAFAETAEFGSPEFQALSDYFDHQDLLGIHQIQVGMAERPGTGEFSEMKQQAECEYQSSRLPYLSTKLTRKKQLFQDTNGPLNLSNRCLISLA